MIEFLSEHWEVIVTAILAVVAGGIVLKVRSHRQSGNSNFVDQSHSSAHGDIVGRDKKHYD